MDQIITERVNDDNTITSLEFLDGKTAEASDMILAKNIAETLHKAYPGHLWATHVNSEQGVVDIKNLRISFVYGFRMKIVDLTPFDSWVTRKLINAGGEMLERAKMKRGGWREGEIAETVDGVKNKPKNIIV